jgi:hypothetical protein
LLAAHCASATSPTDTRGLLLLLLLSCCTSAAAIPAAAAAAVAGGSVGVGDAGGLFSTDVAISAGTAAALAKTEAWAPAAFTPAQHSSRRHRSSNLVTRFFVLLLFLLLSLKPFLLLCLWLLMVARSEGMQRFCYVTGCHRLLLLLLLLIFEDQLIQHAASAAAMPHDMNAGH